MHHTQKFSLPRLINQLWQILAKNNTLYEPSTAPRHLWTGCLMVLLILATAPLQAQVVQTGGGAELRASDGAVNLSFPHVVGEVKVSVSDGAGGFYIGGYFTSVGGITRNNVAQIDVNGTVTSWNPNASGGAVIGMVISGSTVYIGGTFNTVCSAPSSCTNQAATTRNYLAAIGTDGNITSWNPNDVGGGINALAISSDGNTIYVGGDVSSLCTAPSSCTSQVATTRSRIAAIDSSGNVTFWNPGANNTVYALAISGSTLYVGGKFTAIGGVTGTTARSKIAAIDTAATASVNTWNPSATNGTNNTVLALAISGNNVYAGGNFTSIGGASRSRLAALDTTTGLATSWNPNPKNVVSALAISGNTVYAGGSFTGLCASPSTCTSQVSTSRNYLAAIGTNGILGSWNPNADSSVNGLTISGSSVYASGKFTTLTPSSTYYTAPTVTAVTGSADYGNTAGGKAVTITGTNFISGALSVIIGGTAATNVTYVSSTSLTATTPVGVAGTASVLVTTAGGTNADNTLFTYYAAPTVSAISPAYGVTTGGTVVTLTGSGFTGATAVSIGGTAATNVNVVSDTTLTATTPAHAAGAASVLITTADGTNAANSLFSYTKPGTSPKFVPLPVRAVRAF